MYSSSFTTEGMGNDGLPNYIYYNADIINNKTNDANQIGLAEKDPQISFNETRDSPLIKDASKYEFSIIRFTMNGPNLDLPLFIPTIQIDPTGSAGSENNTTYSMAITLQQNFNTNLGLISFNITPDPTFIQYVPENKNVILAPLPRKPTTVQDISTRYYWVSSYNYWLTLVNATLLQAYQTLYNNFQAQWIAYPGLTTSFPFATFTLFRDAVYQPEMLYNEVTFLFSMYLDSNGFGERLLSFTPASPGAATSPRMRLFFNTNMYGLFSNFPTIYWNSPTISTITYDGLVYPAFPNPVPVGYVNEMMVSNKFYENVKDYRNPPYAGIIPAGYVPATAQKAYWIMTQDFKSIDSLWSPISSIVFTTSMLPVKTEAVSQPNVLGTSNTGNSAPTSAAAFEPIITDIALDTSNGGAHDYRNFIYYAPNAEYRMSSLTTSKQEIRSINISVFWKNRLDNQLYPVNAYNLSTTSLKFMFKKIGARGRYPAV